MSNPSASGIGLIIIGDEILSGKRKDKHFATVVDLLDQRGLELSWARIVSDNADLITRTLHETFATDDIVFSFGGIGATPDDRTRQCAADAAGLELEPHPEGVRILEERFGSEFTPQRRRLVEFPKGSDLIPNPVNRVPGFTLHRHHFVPGFPNMAWPMVEWVLDNLYADLHAPGVRSEQAITVWGAKESDVIPTMEDFVQRYPDLRMSCLPSSQSRGFELELAFRGESHQVGEAMERLKARLDEMGFEWAPNAKM